MELILWRHADAEDGAPDLERRLTAKGRKDAERVAGWLLRHLPADFKVVASPAARAQETAQALGMRDEGVARVEVTPITVPLPDGRLLLGEAAREAGADVATN